MSDVGWVVCQFLFLSLKHHRKHSFSLFFIVHTCLLLLPAVAGDRSAFVNVRAAEKSGSPRAVSEQLLEETLLQVQGTFSNAGSVKQADGILHKLPLPECGEEDEASMANRPKDWVALFHYPYRDDTNQTLTNGTNCQSVLDRVKKAMMFGASAVIILALNPKIVRELDIAQLFSRPVVMMEEATNVSAVLDAILSKIKMHVKITFNATFYDLQAQGLYTVYSRCWRPSPGSGLVCQFEGEEFSKTDPGQFWHYFSALAAIFMLLLVIKAKVEDNDNGDMDQVEQALRRIAYQAIAVMKTKRYKMKKLQTNFDDSERDTCAVCLDLFYFNQKIRILPCRHEFHTKCVDPWLLKQHTCPLCKLNIVDVQTGCQAWGQEVN